jgi:hypothetical protein
MTNKIVKTKKQEIEILTAEEIKQLDEAVTFINTKANESAKSLVEIGDYLLKTFFENDIKKAEDRAPRKGISLRKIAAHKDIMLSYRSLANAMRLADQNHLFSGAKFRNLTESHRLLLLNVTEESQKMAFAEKSMKEKLSYRGLRDVLIKENYITPRGRGALPSGDSDLEPDDVFTAFFKPIDRLIKMNFAIDHIELDRLSDSQIQAMTQLKDRLEEILAKVGKTKK